MSKYGHRPHNWFEAIVNKLGGEDQAERFLRGELVVKAAERIFTVWKTLTIGVINANGLSKRLKNEGFYVSDWARNIMGKPAFKTSAEPHEVSFVRVRVADLGFTEMPTTTQLFDRSRLAQFNLDLCEAEDGPHLRLALTDQPRGDWFWVAMEPITGSDGHPYVFNVGRYGDGEQWLFARFAHPGVRWDLGTSVVFRLRK